MYFYCWALNKVSQGSGTRNPLILSKRSHVFGSWRKRTTSVPFLLFPPKTPVAQKIPPRGWGHPWWVGSTRRTVDQWVSGKRTPQVSGPVRVSLVTGQSKPLRESTISSPFPLVSRFVLNCLFDLVPFPSITSFLLDPFYIVGWTVRSKHLPSTWLITDSSFFCLRS